MLRPSAEHIAVKFSVAIVHAAIAVTHHAEHASRMKKLHREIWGDEVYIHMPKKLIKPEFMPYIDYIWSELAGVGGTSSWGAARLAKLLGYEEVILCGCPLESAKDGELYHDAEIFEAANRVGASRHRGEPWANEAAVRQYQRKISDQVDQGLATGIYSMSGWTRDKLGAPNGR